jgi:hypothetical protein
MVQPRGDLYTHLWKRKRNHYNLLPWTIRLSSVLFQARSAASRSLFGFLGTCRLIAAKWNRISPMIQRCGLKTHKRFYLRYKRNTPKRKSGLTSVASISLELDVHLQFLLCSNKFQLLRLFTSHHGWDPSQVCCSGRHRLWKDQSSPRFLSRRPSKSRRIPSGGPSVGQLSSLRWPDPAISLRYP